MKMKKRATIVFGIAFALVVLVVGRLVQLQLLSNRYKRHAIANSRHTVNIPAQRGNILDRNKNPMAVSVKINVCYMFPEEIEDKAAMTEQLVKILNLEKEDVEEKMAKTGTILLKKDLTEEEIKAIEALDSPHIFLKIENGRYYPNETLACHFLGFTNVDNEGAYGLEMEFDDMLTGVPGKELMAKSIQGDRVSYRDNMIYPEQPGQTLVTTIDEGIQNILYKRGKEAYEELKPKEFCLIAMDPNNGDILAMQSFPEFNPNHPREAVREEDQAQWKTMTDEERLNELFRIWKNPVVNDIYEPGSVFKLVTLSAALEENTTDDEHFYYCDGFVHNLPGGFDIRCWSWNDPHGTQDVSHALTNSCNPAFVQIAQELGRTKFFPYINSFGMGKITGIDLPGEATGFAPEKEEDIGPVELATLSFGHGVATTPVQMVTAVSAVVNGGILYEPRVVKETLNSRGEVLEEFPVKAKRQVISAETSEKMRGYMERVVSEGTSIGINGYSIGGKTGTTVKIVEGQYDEEYRLHSFVCVFPAEKPEIVILSMIDESFQAVNPNLNVCQKIIEDIIDYRKYEPTLPTGEEIQ